mmetsp:Transcript_30611/g.42387  ORF Transcript_30611/g.42387 Transcript_30611/m.42387 type:complete len:235 (-) Transcript_30611:357-1061(-)
MATMKQGRVSATEGTSSDRQYRSSWARSRRPLASSTMSPAVNPTRVTAAIRDRAPVTSGSNSMLARAPGPSVWSGAPSCSPPVDLSMESGRRESVAWVTPGHRRNADAARSSSSSPLTPLRCRDTQLEDTSFTLTASNPASSMAWMISALEARAGACSTSASSVLSDTDTLTTPSTLLTAPSTAEEQAEQVMPETRKRVRTRPGVLEPERPPCWIAMLSLRVASKPILSIASRI